MFGLPIAVGDRKIWIKSIPYLTEEMVASLKENPAVCVRHWPESYPEIKSRGNGTMIPAVPPTKFDGIPQASIPTPPPAPRPTKRSSFEVRTAMDDELPEFTASDKVTYEELCSILLQKKHQFNVVTASFIADNALWIVSNTFCSGIPEFSLKIKEDLSFEGFCMGAQCTISTLSKNRITKLDRWSKVDEGIRFLSNKELSQHEKVLKEQVSNMRPPQVGKKLYDADILRR